nr:uncharacterized protein LOC105340281 isoform X6 [Crassostrea gigas]XP_034306573.1 uncharacterized protein LOC117680466 isoform X7 [Crassostrea gigas]|eukprot:XP_011444537.1 PREDICTED: uncharacterized protein LOC105340281 isoform X7 [Crassostrea gigas]
MEVCQRPRTTESIYAPTPDLEPIIERMSKSRDGERMTFWSRYDPIRHVQGNTDHWAKNRQQSDGLRGSMPGAYSSGRPKSTYNKSHYRNVFSERAKDGFRYWLIERPKPTNFGKYGMGSYKTVLGIGNAPRT